jgi:hypothetical protein
METNANISATAGRVANGRGSPALRTRLTCVFHGLLDVLCSQLALWWSARIAERHMEIRSDRTRGGSKAFLKFKCLYFPLQEYLEEIALYLGKFLRN